jgi:outer membrane translocation and assembly module TamA
MRHLIAVARSAAFLGALLFLLCAQRALAQEGEDSRLTVESLTCRGNASTSCEFILGQVYLSPGDPLDEREIREASLRLSVLRNFESVSIYLEKGTRRGRAVVVVEVREASPVNYEAGLGLHSRVGEVGAQFAARATHYNLFGDGKILDAHASTFESFDSHTDRGAFAAIEYIDPHLFGTKRSFMTAGVGYQNQRNEADNGDLFDAEALRFHFTYGRRLWSFSYITAGYQLRPITDIYSRRLQGDGTTEILTSRNHGGPTANFGWNSEDDAYFPTRGSRLSFSYFRDFAARDEYAFSFRKNWQAGGKGVWTFAINPDASLAGTYARPFALDPQAFRVRRAWWRATTFVRPLYREPDMSQVWELGLTVGLQLETRTFGIVNLYVFGSGRFSSGGEN